MTLGAIFAYGNTPEGDELDVGAAVSRDASVRFFRLTFILGFNFEI